MDPNIKFLETQIFFFITRNQPVTRSEICDALEIDVETYFSATLYLRSSKKSYTTESMVYLPARHPAGTG